MLELGEWYQEENTALLDSLDFLDSADAEEEQEGLHSGNEAFMRPCASFGEHCQDRDAVVGESSSRRRPNGTQYPASPHATRKPGARVLRGNIHQVRVIMSSTASMGRGQSRVHSTACDALPQQTQLKAKGVPMIVAF